MTISEQKAALRKEVLARRDAITPDYREGKNILIGAQLFQKIDWEELEQKKEMQAWANAPATGSESVASGEGEGETPRITVSVYSAMKSEPDVSGFAAMAYNHDARVCYPCMERLPEGNAEHRKLHMVFRAVSFEQRETCPFVVNPLQSLSPDDPVLEAYPVVEAEELDVIIVPIVAFDAANNRLGYGGGNYDRLLAQTRADAQVIGVAYEEQRVDAVPLEPFDKPLKSIVSA